MSLAIKLQMFEGPLDLLLHLIDEAKVEIEDIPIHQITDQYLEYVHSMQQLELDIATEFLVMAATLLLIKSRTLLPTPPLEPVLDEWEVAIDPREELIQRLIEYKKYKEAVILLKDLQTERSQIFIKEPDDLTPFVPDVPEEPLRGVELKHIVHAFQRVITRTKKGEQVAKIRRDELSVKDRMREIVQLVRKQTNALLFRALFADTVPTRDFIVVTFLAILELMKTKQIRCYQHHLFDDIVIQHYVEEANGYTDSVD